VIGTRRAYWVLASVIFLNFTAGGATFPFYSLYATSLGASLGQIALVVGLQSITSVVAGLAFGRLADRAGSRRVMIPIGMASLAILSFAMANAPAWGWLIPLQGLLGIASGAEQVAALALMADILFGNPHRGRYISGYRMSGSLAFSIAIVMSGWLANAVGLRGSFQLAAGVYGLAFLVSLFLVDAKHAVPLGPPTSFAILLRGPMRPLLIVALTFGIPFSAVFSVWPIWVADVLGLGQATFSQLWGLAAFIEVPSMLAAGLIVDRLGRRPTFVAGFVGFGLVYLAYFLAPPLPGLIGAQVLRGMAFAAFTATSLTMAIDLAPPDARGRASGLFNSAQGIAQILGNWIGGPLAGAIGFRLLFAIASLTVLGGALYSYIMLATKRPAGQETPLPSPSSAGRG
jgi:MFS family permease